MENLVKEQDNFCNLKISFLGLRFLQTHLLENCRSPTPYSQANCAYFVLWMIFLYSISLIINFDGWMTGLLRISPYIDISDGYFWYFWWKNLLENQLQKNHERENKHYCNRTKLKTIYMESFKFSHIIGVSCWEKCLRISCLTTASFGLEFTSSWINRMTFASRRYTIGILAYLNKVC